MNAVVDRALVLRNSLVPDLLMECFRDGDCFRDKGENGKEGYERVGVVNIDEWTLGGI